MCGILGVRKSWLASRAPIEAALRAMAWRGPDGAVLREDGDWTLGVARLAISDPQASQPIQNAGVQIQVTDLLPEQVFLSSLYGRRGISEPRITALGAEDGPRRRVKIKPIFARRLNR